MKKVLTTLAVIMITAGAFAQKGESSAKPNVIKVNPLGLLFGQASVGFEHAINAKSSFVIAPTFGGYKLGGFKYTSFGGSAEYRFYLSNTKEAPAGFYVAPGIGFTAGKTKVDDGSSTSEAKFTSFGGKAVLGNQWVFKSGFVIDLNGGVSYQSFSYKDNNNSIFGSLKGSGVFPALAFAIGYNF